MASTAPPVAAFGTQLANVRRLTASNQAHQAKPAQLLSAIEASISATLPNSTLPHSPTAYFSALLQVLEKACSDEIKPGETGEEVSETEKMDGGALIPATLYLLAIVVPETPSQVVLSKLSSLMECLLPLFDTALEHPPALRSLLQITTSVLLFATLQPGVLASSPHLKRAWNYMLELNLDPRPKVRHLAQEGIRKVLTTPVPPRVAPGAHYYLPRTREWITSTLEEEMRTGSSSKAKKARFADSDDAEGKKAIWVVQGLRGWVAVWGDEQLSQLCSLLLSLPPHAHLTTQVYSLLSHLLSPPPADATSAKPAVLTNLPKIVDSLLSSSPEIGSVDIAPYLSALSSALVKMALQDPINLNLYLPKAFNLMFNDLLLAPSATPAVCKAAAEAVADGIVRFCITDEVIVASVAHIRTGAHLPGARKKQKTPFLTRVLSAVTEALDSHALRMPYLFVILTALISRLRLRILPGKEAKIDPAGIAPTAAEELLLPLIQDVGDLRSQKGFEAKDKVDELVGMAIEVIGVEAVLRALPLNIEPDAAGRTPQPGRAHLLPIIRAKVTNDSLAFFANYFRPLSERVFERKVAAEDGGRGMEAKVWEAIVAQVWDCLPGFCNMPRDMKDGLTTPFLSLITNLLYSQPLLLPPLLRALSELIESTQRLIVSTTDPAELRKTFGIDQEVAKANLEVLKGLAKDMVSVLLNVFSKLPREQRKNVGDCIGVWSGILPEKDIIETYNTVATHLSSNLDSTQIPAEGASPISHTMLDLLTIFVPYLPSAQSASLFAAISTKELLEHIDATVQKKAYRLLKRLIEAEKLGEIASGDKLEEFVERLNEVAVGVGPGAQRDRLQLLAALVKELPKERLHLIPELLTEAVLGTKEVNEKARDAGFDLLVIMGHKMAEGGEVKQSIPVDDDSEEMADATVQADVKEYITMVATSLTAETPHMISASINALSRLLFEFKDEIPNEFISELVATVIVFVASKNREIVKSALGFIKVAVVALPVDTVEPHLDALVPALLGWVHDHKNHFKSKTVHIFERMIRKFGYEAVYAMAPNGGERKVLENIKRRKDRAKRKKAAGEGDDDDEERPKASAGNAFDDILYNSDSELESDGDDEGKSSRSIKPLSKRQRKAAAAAAAAQYIKGEGDQPLDLLSRSIAGGVTQADPAAADRKRKPGQDAAHFKTDKSGRLIIEDERNDDGDDAMVGSAADRAAGAGNAYLAGMRGVDGATRDSTGALRFNKNTKRAREAEREEAAMDLDDLIGDKPKKKKKAPVQRLGEEFRPKRAGGDIKKQGGPDPFSYVPIGQAAQRRGGKGAQRVSLTNKKRGSRA